MALSRRGGAAGRAAGAHFVIFWYQWDGTAQAAMQAPASTEAGEWLPAEAALSKMPPRQHRPNACAVTTMLYLSEATDFAAHSLQ